MSTTLTQTFLVHRRSLLATVLKIVRDRQIAEDLAQEAYVKAFAAQAKGTIQHPVAFLHQTARNLALDHERRRTMRERYEDLQADEDALASVAAGLPNAEEVLIERESFRQFDKVLESLPPRARQAWTLSQAEGWTYEQIAEHLGVSKNTVYNDIKLVMGHCYDVMKRLDQGGGSR